MGNLANTMDEGGKTYKGGKILDQKIGEAGFAASGLRDPIEFVVVSEELQ
jgi:hypothetical protein